MSIFSGWMGYFGGTTTDVNGNLSKLPKKHTTIAHSKLPKTHRFANSLPKTPFFCKLFADSTKRSVECVLTENLTVGLVVNDDMAGVNSHRLLTC